MRVDGRLRSQELLIELEWGSKAAAIKASKMMAAAKFHFDGHFTYSRQCETQTEYDEWRSHSINLVNGFGGYTATVGFVRPPEPTPAVDMESIANKIKKLLALSQSPNEAEAIAASQKAQELLTRHNLSMADLADSSQEDVEQHEVSSQ